MEHTLHVVEMIHWVALTFMGTVYVLRLLWMFKFKPGKDNQKPGESFGNTTIYPALYSLANVAMPAGMESTRNNFTFYLTFVIFHIGAVSGIFFAIISSAYPPFVQIPVISYLFMTILSITFLVAIYRLVRRFSDPVLRLVSSPDDYFAIMTLTVWLGLSVPAVAYAGGLIPNMGFMVAFLIATSFFLIYVPFSKISHYLYYPFSRYYIGRTLGHRGSLPHLKSRG